MERELVQPYSMIVNLERNLTPWDTSQPSIGVTFHLGTFNVSVKKRVLMLMAYLVYVYMYVHV